MNSTTTALPDFSLEKSEVFFRISLALCYGLAVGLQRELENKVTGMRTHALVSVGACLFTLIGRYGNEEFRVNGVNAGDPTRVAAQIVSGIGFLGAGAIMKGDNKISGLSSAASIWLTAALGMGAAAWLWWATFLGWLALMLTLLVIKQVEDIIAKKLHTVTLEVTFKRKESLQRLVINLYQYGAKVKAVKPLGVVAGHVVCLLRVTLPRKVQHRHVVTVILNTKGLGGRILGKGGTDLPSVPTWEEFPAPIVVDPLAGGFTQKKGTVGRADMFMEEEDEDEDDSADAVDHGDGPPHQHDVAARHGDDILLRDLGTVPGKGTANFDSLRLDSLGRAATSPSEVLITTDGGDVGDFPQEIGDSFSHLRQTLHDVTTVVDKLSSYEQLSTDDSLKGSVDPMDRLPKTTAGAASPESEDPAVHQEPPLSSGGGGGPGASSSIMVEASSTLPAPLLSGQHDDKTKKKKGDKKRAKKKKWAKRKKLAKRNRKRAGGKKGGRDPPVIVVTPAAAAAAPSASAPSEELEAMNAEDVYQAVASVLPNTKLRFQRPTPPIGKRPRATSEVNVKSSIQSLRRASAATSQPVIHMAGRGLADPSQRQPSVIPVVRREPVPRLVGAATAFASLQQATSGIVQQAPSPDKKSPRSPP